MAKYKPKKERKQKVSKSVARSMNLKLMGNEPNVAGKTLKKLDLINQYNWYTGHYETGNKACKASKAYVLVWLKENVKDKRVALLVDSVPDFNFMTVGWQARMLSMGATLPTESMEWFKNKIHDLISKGQVIMKNKKAPVVDETTNAPKLSVQDHIAAQVADYTADLDVEFDKASLNPKKVEFNPTTWLASKKVKSAQSKKIGDHYKTLLKELEVAIKKKDDQVTEAYSTYSAKELKILREFVSSLIVACESHAIVAKAERKPRKRKNKTAEQVTAKVKYKPMDDKYKVQSVHPSNIVGAQSLWVFNTKTRKLGVFYAKDAAGLTIKGTTVQDFIAKESVTKKLRKPEKVLPNVIGGGKVMLRKIMDEIKAKASPIKGRINGDVLLLRVIK